MSNGTRLGVAAVAALALAACGGPLGPIAGGELAGTVATAPAQWVGVPDAIQLETRPTAPYSVNLWSVGIGPHLYVATGPESSDWMTHVQADPRVRVRINGNVYALQAVAVDDPEERQRAVEAYERKYGGTDDDSAGLFGIRERRRAAMRSAMDSGRFYRLQPR